jgi:hypothetical protein
VGELRLSTARHDLVVFNSALITLGVSSAAFAAVGAARRILTPISANPWKRASGNSVPKPSSTKLQRKMANQRTRFGPARAPQSRGRCESDCHTRPNRSIGTVGEGCFLRRWRREWDSNPRYGFPYTRFPSVRLKPLGHPSRALQCAQYSPARPRNKLAKRFAQTLASVQKSRVN